MREGCFSSSLSHVHFLAFPTCLYQTPTHPCTFYSSIPHLSIHPSIHPSHSCHAIPRRHASCVLVFPLHSFQLVCSYCRCRFLNPHTHTHTHTHTSQRERKEGQKQKGGEKETELCYAHAEKETMMKRFQEEDGSGGGGPMCMRPLNQANGIKLSDSRRDRRVVTKAAGAKDTKCAKQHSSGAHSKKEQQIIRGRPTFECRDKQGPKAGQD
ncbi:uncharacterized protein IWZ02DRAFT_47793 [Phyllosticta citriasiana]|uniref:uncharacterized protein n=1 Tax=Phyllosticta citriasiana TaxID=595635 RepID=UPI0030FD685C